MPKPKRVLCLMDLSVVGRAGLAVALPILAACGVQASPLPTALFSAHTGGFGPVEKRDQSAFGFAALAHFKREGISFDAVSTGYLYGEDQFRLAAAALDQYPDALHLVDPAMADDGKLYTGFDQTAVDSMKALCERAQLITPNVTESALLVGEEPAGPPSPQALLHRLETLGGGARAVLITSAPSGDGGWQILGREAKGRTFAIPSRHVPQKYPGTGDSLAAAVCGLMLRGLSLEDAARRASRFVEDAAARTYQGCGEARHGLWMETLLPTLAPEAANE